MGLDGTMLHYLAVRKAMVSVHRPIHSKITLTYSLTWQTDHFTPRRMAFKALLNAKVAGPFLGFAQVFSAAYYSEKLPERAPTKKTATCTVDYRSTTCVGTPTIRLRSIKSSLPFSLPLHHSCDKLSQALSRFSVLHASDGKLGGAWERGYYFLT